MAYMKREYSDMKTHHGPSFPLESIVVQRKVMKKKTFYPLCPQYLWGRGVYVRVKQFLRHPLLFRIGKNSIERTVIKFPSGIL